MPSYRMDRIAEDMKRELSDIFRSLKDPRISGMLSIVHLEVSGDLSYAKVHVSAMEGLSRAKESVKGLSSAAGYIRRELAARLRLRKGPQLRFVADDSIQYSAEISRVLKDIEEQTEEKKDED